MSISQNFPNEGPNLNLNFAGSKHLDSRITFTRSTTGTYLNANGLIATADADTPRFHHTYNGNNLQSSGLLVEPSKTNIVTYSQSVDDASWIKTNTTVTANSTTTTAPDGTNTADLVVESAVTGLHSVRPSTTTLVLTANLTYTFSAFVKRNGRDITLQVNNNATTPIAVVLFTWNLSTKTYVGAGIAPSYPGITNTSGTIEEYPNGWYRITATFTAANTGESYFYIGADNNPSTIKTGTVSYLGDGTSGFYIWGVQVEQSSFATSYIPTEASTVTRGADTASITGTNYSSIVNANNAGTLVETTSTSTTKPISGINTSSIYIGGLTTVTYPFNNIIKTFSYYPTPLSYAQSNAITALEGSYDGKIITNGLVLHLDAGNFASYNGSGTTWTDLSGNGNNGTLTNGPTYSSANRGSIVFDGSNDYIGLGTSANIVPPYITVSLFVNVNNYTTRPHLFGRGEGTIGHCYFVIETSGAFRFYTDIGSGWSFIQPSSFTFPTGVWYNIVCSFDGSNVNVYGNGVLLGTSSRVGQLRQYTAQETVVGRILTQNYFPGNIAQVSIYNRALTATEVAKNFNSTRGRFGI
jgi:hypothetical protein